jgi:flagellar FliL protein
MSEQTEPVPAAPQPKSSKKKLLIIVAAVVVIVAGGGGFWWTRMAKAQAAGAEAAPKEVTRGLLKFDPFVVNLADGGTRFLRTTLQIVVEPEEKAAHITENPVLMLQLRSAVLELLAQQTATALVTPEGKAAMKAAIISRAQEALDGGKIADVLFSEFVVQF